MAVCQTDLRDVQKRSSGGADAMAAGGVARLSLPALGVLRLRPQAWPCQRRSPRRQLKKKRQEPLQAPRCTEAFCTPGGVRHLVSRGVTTDPKPNRKVSDVRQQRRLRTDRAE